MYEELTRKELAILRALTYLYREDYKLASTPGPHPYRSPGLEEHLHEVEVLREKLACMSERIGTQPSA
jgi:hypothetical protein